VNSSDAVFPKIVFSRLRAEHPALSEAIDTCERNLGMAEAFPEHWRAEFLTPTPARYNLKERCAVMATAWLDRASILGDGLAHELEASRLFSAAAIARSMLELVGLCVVGPPELVDLVEGSPTDVEPIHLLTIKLLLATRSIDRPSQPAVYRIDRLINAAKERFGDHFGEDYGFLSDLSHPNASGIWGARSADDDLFFERPSVNEGQAELMLKVLHAGLHSVARDCLTLIEWSVDHDVELPAPLG